MNEQKNSKLWAGRSNQETSQLLDLFNSSFPFDFRLWEADIKASQAHAKMLGETQIIAKEDAEKITAGLKQICNQITENPQAWFKAHQNEEDIHMAIERQLTELIGDPARKLHTARSRNDQVATDIRLWLRKQNYQICSLINELRATLLKLAERDAAQIMPGYTHLQRAQPISLGHHWLAHYERFSRDYDRFTEIRARLKFSPLGSGALAGTTYPIDRQLTSMALGFTAPCNNSLDAVSDRDFVAEHQFTASLLMVHLSQLSEELILWSTDEFKFLELDDRFATGSSMMPQKKNPDVPELIRGKSGRVLGNLTAILMLLKGLPLAYNKDLQEDKEGLFDTCDTLQICLKIMSSFLDSLKINNDRLTRAAGAGFMNATDAADYLVKKGVPFREAYYAVGQAVQYCIKEQKLLNNLNEKELKTFHPKFDLGALEAIEPANCLQNRTSLGGTSPTTVRGEISKAWVHKKQQTQSLEDERKSDPCEQ
jgi:argininosuccinate lyase